MLVCQARILAPALFHFIIDEAMVNYWCDRLKNTFWFLSTDLQFVYQVLLKPQWRYECVLVYINFAQCWGRELASKMTWNLGRNTQPPSGINILHFNNDWQSIESRLEILWKFNFCLQRIFQACRLFPEYSASRDICKWLCRQKLSLLSTICSSQPSS